MNKKDRKRYYIYVHLIIYNKSELELLSVFILYCLFYNAPQFYPNLL